MIELALLLIAVGVLAMSEMGRGCLVVLFWIAAIMVGLGFFLLIGTAST